MRKILFMIATAGAFNIVMTGANAATQCVALVPGGVPPCTTTSGEYNTTDWGANCTYNDKTTAVRGVAACSSDEHALGTTLLSLTQDSNNSKNIYCWCKMVAPVESKWVWGELDRFGGNGTAEDCRKLCAYACPRNLEDNGSLGADRRWAIFSNIIK